MFSDIFLVLTFVVLSAAKPNDVKLTDPVYKFKRSDIHIGVNSDVLPGKLLLPVSNLYVKANGTSYERVSGLFRILSSDRFMNGSKESSGSAVPSPFNLTTDGILLAAVPMAEYNNDRFELVVVGSPTSASSIEASLRITVWISEPEDQLKILLNKTAEEVNLDRFAPLTGLANVTSSYLLAPSDLKDYIDNKNVLHEDKCLLFFHVVNPTTRKFVPVTEVLEIIDRKYDELKKYYNASQSGIVSITPAVQSPEDYIEPEIAAMIAILVVMSVAFVTTIISCCCLHYWPEKERKTYTKAPIPPALAPETVKVPVQESRRTGTDNPLWMERAGKPYEEQELTMRISDGDSTPPKMAPPFAKEHAIPPQFNMAGIDEPDSPNVFFSSTLTLNKMGEPQLVSDLL